MAFESIQERWDAFLANIEIKFHEVLSTAEAILPSLLDYQNFDTAPFTNAWQGIYSQAHSLVFKIEPTWHDQVEKLFSKEGRHLDIKELNVFNARVTQEMDKGYAMSLKLEKELHSYQVRTYAEAAKKLLAKAKEILGKQFHCSQCQAPLPVRENFFRSYYLTCDFCNTVNTFEPGTIARNIEHFSLHALGEEAALQAYLNYHDLDYRKRVLKAPLTKQQVLEAYEKYIDLYLKRRIEIMPEYADRLADDKKAKMEFQERYYQE